MAEEPEVPEVSVELEEARAHLPEAFRRAPIIDAMNAQQLELLRSRAAASGRAKPTDSELAAFLELAAAYGLDPFAQEVWLAKGSSEDGASGRVLIMVGRDGLRKIAERSGLTVDCDVIHENDEFKVVRTAVGERAVEHSYGHPKERGEIVGAWAEVRAPRRLQPMTGASLPGRVRGFFIAEMKEFQPTGRKLQYSPWGSQTSVMILAAAERQALRQATPLSGLIAQGELDKGAELAAGEGEPDLADVPLADSVRATCKRAERLGHVGLADLPTAAMALGGADEEYVRDWLRTANNQLDIIAEGEPSDAEVVQDPESPPEWSCQNCGQTNSAWARECGRCEQARPEVEVEF